LSSFGDRQGLDRQADRAVGIFDHRSVDGYVGDDLAGNGEFGFGQVTRERLGNGGRARAGDAQVDAVALAGKGQRLPVG
jgi:hypothetical protein